jgi:phosphoribosylamine--glycine ligase
MDSVLIVGGGGREHALLKALLRCDRALCTYAYPGNPGMEADGCMLVDSKIGSWKDLARWAEENEIDLTVVGPEQPLVEGIVDEFMKRKLRIFGPSKAAAQIEGSKHFAKNLMKKYRIPTAEFVSVTSKKDAVRHIDKAGTPIVVKASGLAAGKGAIVCETRQEALDAVDDMFEKNVFGDAASTVILEEKMTGEEASVFVLTDGAEFRLLPVSQDHKPVFDNDRGPNTGGMGAYAPAPVVDEAMTERISREIISPVLSALRKEHAGYTGLLYAGIMLTAHGPKVVEFNCRFGDPETQAVLPLVECDWFEVLSACCTGDLSKVRLKVRELACAAVVCASKGYPGAYPKGLEIGGVDEVEHGSDNVDVYQAGTKRDANGTLVTSGGRVLAVSGWAPTLREAVDTVYRNINKIHFDGMHYRNDIAAKGLARLNKK